MKVASYLLEIRKTQVRRVWSSIKVINHGLTEEVITLNCSKTSLWIRVKGWVGLVCKVVREKKLNHV